MSGLVEKYRLSSRLLSKDWIECIGFEIVLVVVFFLSKGHNEVGVSLKENKTE